MADSFIEAIRSLVLASIESRGLMLSEDIVCSYKTGYDLELPSRDYALLRGREILLECCFRDSIAQVFTVAPRGYRGSIGDVFSLDLRNSYNRSLFYAVASAILKHFRASALGTIHCSGCKPRECGRLLAKKLYMEYGGSARVLHIGYQPSHVEELYRVYRDNLLVTDLSRENLWVVKNNRLVYDGLDNRIYIGSVDIVLATASSIVNNTFWEILENVIVKKKKLIVYGVTATPIIELLREKLPFDIEFFCPYSL